MYNIWKRYSVRILSVYFLFLFVSPLEASLPVIEFDPQFPIFSYRLYNSKGQLELVDVGIISENCLDNYIRQGLVNSSLKQHFFAYRCTVVSHTDHRPTLDPALYTSAIFSHVIMHYYNYSLFNPRNPINSRKHLSSEKKELELYVFTRDAARFIIIPLRDFFASFAGALTSIIVTQGKSAVIAGAEIKRMIVEETVEDIGKFISQNNLQRGIEYYREIYLKLVKRKIDALNTLLEYLDKIENDPDWVPNNEDINQILLAGYYCHIYDYSLLTPYHKQEIFL